MAMESSWVLLLNSMVIFHSYINVCRKVFFSRLGCVEMCRLISYQELAMKALLICTGWSSDPLSTHLETSPWTCSIFRARKPWLSLSFETVAEFGDVPSLKTSMSTGSQMFLWFPIFIYIYIYMKDFQATCDDTGGYQRISLGIECRIWQFHFVRQLNGEK